MKLHRSDLGHRPVAVRILVGLLVFLGITAIGGGLAMLGGIEGAAPPEEWLADIPIVDSWVVPGLVLTLVFGLGSLLAAYGVFRRPHWGWMRPVENATRHHWSETAAVALGLGQVAWIGLEVVYLDGLSWLMPFYGSVGLAIALSAVAPGTRGYLALPISVVHVGAAQEGAAADGLRRTEEPRR
ncbi:MAG: hypothetical protein R3320_09915 [Nitriliruptorales bacterium]|nr:hypothetical protein [Nitriliruptorales bacterium]